jgi:hypothetical protein
MRLGIYCRQESHSIHYGNTHILQLNSIQNDGADHSLARFNAFATEMRSVIRRHPSKTIVVCIGRNDESRLYMTAVLLGGFLILENNMDFDQVTTAFQSVDAHFDRMLAGSPKVSVHDCWRALSHARSLGWMHLFRDVEMTPSPASVQPDDETPVELEEMLHYASPLNGNVHAVVPGKILCFPTPATLPANHLWMDEEAAGRGLKRRFSAAFLADLLADLGVDVAVCLHASAYDRAPFTAHNIEVEDLLADPAGPHMLRAIDRFLAVAAAAPGLIALHSGTPDDPGLLGALVLSYLTRRLRFDPDSAVAWIAMVHPALLAAAPLPGPAAAAAQPPPGPAAAVILRGGGRALARAASASGGAAAARARPRVGARLAALAFRRAASSPGRLPLLLAMG